MLGFELIQSNNRTSLTDHTLTTRRRELGRLDANQSTENDDVRFVTPGLVIERSAAGDKVQVTPAGGTVDKSVGKVRLGVLNNTGHSKKRDRVVGETDLDKCSKWQSLDIEEDSWSKV